MFLAGVAGGPGQVVAELHGHIARAISHRSGGVFLTSFVSKYLHSHCPIVPIYDSNAQDAIGDLVDWKLVEPIREATAKLPEWTAMPDAVIQS